MSTAVKQKYQDKQFLDVLDPHIPTALSNIFRSVGCSRDVAKLHMAELERAGLVARIDIQGGSPAWIRSD